MSWIKDRLLLLIVSIIAAIGAHFFWSSLDEYAFTVFPLIALFALLLERPWGKKKKNLETTKGKILRSSPLKKYSVLR